MNLVLSGGFMPLGLSALFTTAVAYNAVIFAFMARWENFFVCCFMFGGSVFVTLIGFSVLKYAEQIESLSEQVVKELQEVGARHYSRLMTQRHQRAMKNCGEISGGYSAYIQRGSRWERNFRRMPLRLQVKPFGMVKVGHSVVWIQQIIENSVSAIFMVTVLNKRLLL